MNASTWKNYVMTGVILAVGLLTGCNVSAKNGDTQKSKHDLSPELRAREKIKADLELKIEKLEVKSVRQLPYSDLFEVVLANNEIVYTNAKTEFTLIGHMINNADMSDMTQARIDELSVVDFKALPFAQSFKQVKGDGLARSQYSRIQTAVTVRPFVTLWKGR